MSPVLLPQRFQLVRELGRGGMGAVYEAIDTRDGAHVAIKTLPSDDPVAIARFKREFRSLADIHHPNLVTLHELFCEEGQWAFSMDVIRGVDFLEYVWTAPRALEGDDDRRFSAETVPSAPKDCPLAPLGDSSTIAWREEHDRTAMRCNVERLRAGLVQLSQALGAIHRAGKVHRDVKPANIRVRDDGHLFLLDFGLVSELASDAGLTAPRSIFGTPAFMAPEQARQATVGPAADWYSVGVILFAALTGSLPFEGAGMQVLLAKLTADAPRARDLCPAAPEDLDELCAALLAREPAERPLEEAVLRRVGREVRSKPTVAAYTPGTSLPPPFVGRGAELAALEAAFTTVARGNAAAILLEGDSGTGKSCLARRFVERALEAEPNTVVVAGRCYENEAVPYNAWDGAVDALASFWVRQRPEDAAALMPKHIGALARTFPALRRVPTVERGASRVTPKLDPLEVRSRAFAAMRDLLERIAQTSPVILFLDDLQWADRDSINLLAEVMREPFPPAILLLATARPLARYPDVEAALRDALPQKTFRCDVAELPDEDAVALATELLSRMSPLLVSKAHAIAREAHGHALFISELAEHVGQSGSIFPASLSLEEAIQSRVARLPPEARALLGIISLAARPIPVAVAGRASDLTPDDEPRVLAALRVGHLTRTARVDGEDCVEAFHARVGSAVVALLSAEDKAKAYGRLAAEFERSLRADPGVIAELFVASGDVERAAVHARVAADRGAAALAFDRAARFYAIALERPSASVRERHELRVALAEALANAGQSGQATDAFERAMAGVSGAEREQLERRMGEQLLRAGRYDAGIEVAKRALARVGVSWPNSDLWVILSILWLRFILRLRGRRFREREATLVSARDLERIDVCWSVGASIAMSDSIRAIVFQLHHLRFALAAGELRRVSFALGLEIPRDAALDGVNSQAKLRRLRANNEKVRALVLRSGLSYERAMCELGAGMALIAACSMRDGALGVEKAEAMLREECAGKLWEIATARVWATRAHFHLGDYTALVDTQARMLQEATDRRDLYSLTHARIGYANFAWLVRGEPEAARRALDLARETLAVRGFALENLYAFIARNQIALYTGDVATLEQTVAHEWPAFLRSPLRRLPAARCATSMLRASLHIALAVSTERDRSTNMRSAHRFTRDTAKADIAFTAPFLALLHAQLALVERKKNEVEGRLRRACALLTSAELHGHAAVARRALGKCVGGAEGGELVAQAERSLRAQSVKQIPELCRCLAPGFVELE